jgi:hypothetical protein
MVNGVRIQFTPEEEAARDAEEAAWAAGAFDRAIARLREDRNRRLAATDLYALQDVTLTEDMRDYRQALRDLPAGLSTVDDVNNAVWPEE